MRLINRNKHDPVFGKACAAALKAHAEKFGEHGRQCSQAMYTVLIEGNKVTVEVINRRRSYVATAMTGARHLRRLPGIADF